jgi:hypothetical protein
MPFDMLPFSMQELHPLLARDAKRRRLAIIAVCVGLPIFFAVGVWLDGWKVFLVSIAITALVMMPFDLAGMLWDRRRKG